MALHHLYGVPECPLCEDKLKTAHPELRDIYKKQIKPNFPDCHVSWAWRNEEDQNRFFAQHRSDCEWPHSPHNKMDDGGNPCSLALDLFKMDQNLVASFPTRLYFEISEFLKSNALQVRWGGAFRTISDYDHFELIIN